MGLRTLLGHVGTLAVAALVAVVVLGALFGQPLLVSFVETGSMRPVLAPGDGFVVVPGPLAGPIESGDVVVYDAERIHGSGLVTHRVVGATDRGFVTKGDANAFTDQGSGEPPVKRPQIVGVALQVNGRVVVVPHLGTVVDGAGRAVGAVQAGIVRLVGSRALLGTQGLAYLLFGASLLWYLVGLWRERGGKTRRRTSERDRGQSPRLVLGVLVVVVVVAATVGMVGPAGVTKYGVVSAHYDSEGPRVIPLGESETTTYRMGNGGLVPVVVFLEPASQGIDVSSRELRVEGRSGANATVTLSVPPETGYYHRYLIEHRYFALLPPPLIGTLHEVHPLAPVVAIDALVGVSFYAVGIALLGRSRIRVRPRSGDLGIVTRLRRAVRTLYRP